LQEVEVYSDVKEVLTREALSFLGGLGNMTQQFQVKTEPNSWLLLLPKNKKSPFKNIRLRIDPSSFLATEVVLSPRQGNESRYILSHIQTPAINSAVDFVFQPPAGTEVTTLP
jgi:outer membrane lipoprotein-sorting protein